MSDDDFVCESPSYCVIYTVRTKYVCMCGIYVCVRALCNNKIKLISVVCWSNVNSEGSSVIWFGIILC
jgi:hypothetical protein